MREIVNCHTNQIEGAWKHAKDHFKVGIWNVYITYHILEKYILSKLYQTEMVLIVTILGPI